ncbi:MAG TPA: CGNR zinc finger domain-containing protein [Pseudonocardia sp.]
MSRLPPDLARRFRSGRPCLDLVHTGGDGELAKWEIIHGPDDLARFLGVILGLGAVRATAEDVADMRLLRSAITQIAYGLAAEAFPRAADVVIVNRYAATSPLAPALVPADPASSQADRTRAFETADAPSSPPRPGACGDVGPLPRVSVRAAVIDPAAPAALATLARDAVDLFSGPLASRIRVCAAVDCGLLLVDTSRPGRRRWCSMQRCGNRAKIREHRARRTAD